MVALHQRQPDGSWSEYLTPARRLAESGAPVGRRLNSSSLGVDGDTAAGSEPPAQVEVRVALRRTFPPGADVGQWVVSGHVTVITLPAEDRFESAAAGDCHACDLRGDRSITCWGRNGDGEAVAPGGRLSSVAAGHRPSCGIRTDGTVLCWGHGSRGQSDVPAGQFIALTVGREYSCGLRPGGTIDCWNGGTAAQRDAPSRRHYASPAVEQD